MGQVCIDCIHPLYSARDQKHITSRGVQRSYSPGDLEPSRGLGQRGHKNL